MKKEEIVKICESFGDRARGIVKYINYRHKEIDNLKSQLSETEEKLKEAYKFVMKNNISSRQNGLITRYVCNGCNSWEHTIKDIRHDLDCIVLEAQTWLEDKE